MDEPLGSRGKRHVDALKGLAGHRDRLDHAPVHRPGELVRLQGGPARHLQVELQDLEGVEGGGLELGALGDPPVGVDPGHDKLLSGLVRDIAEACEIRDIADRDLVHEGRDLALVLVLVVDLGIREMQRDGRDVGGLLDQPGERELPGLQVHHLGRLVVDRDRGIDPQLLEAGDVGDESLEVEHLARVGGPELEERIPAGPAVLVDAGVLKALVVQEIIRELADPGGPRDGAVLLVRQDRDVAREAVQAAVIQGKLDAEPAHEARLLLVDDARGLPKVDRDVGLALVVLGLDDRGDDAGRPGPDEGEPGVVVAHDDGVLWQERAAGAKGGP